MFILTANPNREPILSVSSRCGLRLSDLILSFSEFLKFSYKNAWKTLPNKPKPRSDLAYYNNY